MLSIDDSGALLPIFNALETAEGAVERWISKKVLMRRQPMVNNDLFCKGRPMTKPLPHPPLETDTTGMRDINSGTKVKSLGNPFTGQIVKVDSNGFVIRFDPSLETDNGSRQFGYADRFDTRNFSSVSRTTKKGSQVAGLAIVDGRDLALVVSLSMDTACAVVG